MEGKTVLVTGAAGALGSALSQLCLKEGFNTIMLDGDRRGLEQAYDQITVGHSLEPALYPMDLSAVGTEHFEEMRDMIESEFNGLDALIHCASRFEGLMPLEHVPPQEWLKHMQVNLNAAWMLSIHSLPMLREAGAGRLYFLLEDLPKVQGAFWGPYGVSKHALRALVSQFAAELKATDVQVLGIDPGPMSSPLRSRAYHEENPATQNDPVIAAEQIMALLKGKQEVSGDFVKLGSN